MKTIKRTILAIAMLAGSASLSFATDPADSYVPADSYAAMGWYLRGDLGWSWLTWDRHDDSAFGVGGGVGYQYDDYLRSDLRIDWAGYYDTSNFKDDIGVTTVLGNIYFDMPTHTMVNPYLGAGVGYGWASIDHGNDKDGFAYALMAGANVGLTDNVSVDVEYRFRDILASGANPMEHQLLTGVRYKF